MRFDPDTIQPLLQTLGEATDAITVDILAVDGALPLVSWGSASRAGLRGPAITAMRAAIRDLTQQVAASDDDSCHEARADGYELVAAPVRYNEFRGGVCVARRGPRPWSETDRKSVV